MGMFGDLMGKIFRHGSNAERPPDAVPVGHGGGISQAPGNPQMSEVEKRAAAGQTGGSMASGSSAQGSNVDVEAVLGAMADSKGEKLDWKHSIVDLLKLVDMDSSMTARKELATELHFTGDTNDSAAMNIWLHKEVMKKLAANGGKVPADLLDN